MDAAQRMGATQSKGRQSNILGLELLLNLVWLATAVSLFALLWRQLRSDAGRGRAVQRYLAAAVLSFLLLPVISMTDDLHAMSMMAEGERTGGKMIASQDEAQHSSQVMFLLPAGEAAQLEAPLFCFGILDGRSPVSSARPQYISSRSNRAPPSEQVPVTTA